MKAAPFEYHAPQTLEEALGLLAEFGDEAKVLAGGQSLVPILALRLARFEHLIDLNRIPALRYVTGNGGVTRVGAMTTQAAIGGSAEVRGRVPLLADATAHIGHFQIRNRGTIGGSLSHADPGAEYPAVAVALDAEIVLASVRGTRTVGATEFFTGSFTTAAEPDEVLTEIRCHRLAARGHQRGGRRAGPARRAHHRHAAGAGAGAGRGGRGRPGLSVHVGGGWSHAPFWINLRNRPARCAGSGRAGSPVRVPGRRAGGPPGRRGSAPGR
jgi:CO/xanthine dehydrogenase FAD-binding subunit